MKTIKSIIANPIFSFLTSVFILGIILTLVSCQYTKQSKQGQHTIQSLQPTGSYFYEKLGIEHKNSPFFLDKQKMLELNRSQNDATLVLIDDSWASYWLVENCNILHALPSFDTLLFLSDQINRPYINFTLTREQAFLQECTVRAIWHSIAPYYWIKKNNRIIQKENKSIPNSLFITDEIMAVYGQETNKQFITSLSEYLQITINYYSILDVIKDRMKQALKPFPKSGVTVLFTVGDRRVADYYRELYYKEFIEKNEDNKEDENIKTKHNSEENSEENLKLYKSSSLPFYVQSCPYVDAAIQQLEEAVYPSDKKYLPRMVYQGPSDLNPHLPFSWQDIEVYEFNKKDGTISYDTLNENHYYRVQLNSIENYLRYYIKEAQFAVSNVYKNDTSFHTSLKIHYVFLSPEFSMIQSDLLNLLNDSSFSKMQSVHFLFDSEQKGSNNTTTAGSIPTQFFLTYPNPYEPSIITNSNNGLLYEYKIGRKQIPISLDKDGLPPKYAITVPISRKVIPNWEIEYYRTHIPEIYKDMQDFNNSSLCNYLRDDQKM